MIWGVEGQGGGGGGSRPTDEEDECGAGVSAAQRGAAFTVAVSPVAHSDAACDLAEGSYLPEADPVGVSAEGSVPKSTHVRACCMCGSQPDPQGGAKLRRCGSCKSAQYCSAECQRQHWGEGGHREVCPQLREGGKGPAPAVDCMNPEHGTILCGNIVP